MLLSEGEQQAELSKLFPSFFGDGVAESTPVDRLPRNWRLERLSRYALANACAVFNPSRSVRWAMCVHVSSRSPHFPRRPACYPLFSRPRPISPAATFSLSLHRFPSPIVEFATKTPRPSERLSPESCCSETLGIDKANERPHPNKATTSPRAIPGVHRQLERRAD